MGSAGHPSVHAVDRRPGGQRTLPLPPASSARCSAALLKARKAPPAVTGRPAAGPLCAAWGARVMAAPTAWPLPVSCSGIGHLPLPASVGQGCASDPRPGHSLCPLPQVFGLMDPASSTESRPLPDAPPRWLAVQDT